jgi:hypothetical protein
VRNHEKPEDPDAQISSFVCRERPIVADSCLSHCNIVGKWSESAQKAANGRIWTPPRLQARC